MSEGSLGLKKGDEIRVRRSTEAPILARLTKCVAAAVACGFRFSGKKAFLDATEMTAEGPRREVTWSFRDGTITFRPIREPETVGFDEFWRRLHDRDWCRRNPDHPISHIVATIDQLQNIEGKLQGKPECGEPLIRHLLIRKGTRKKLYVPKDTPQEQIDELLRKFKMS